MLEWASECAAGSWETFKNAHEWLLNSGRSQRRPVRAGRTARSFATLGHLEIDWASGRWCATRPMLTLLPNTGGHALLLGCRTRQLWLQLEEATSPDATDALFLDARRQQEGPEAVYLASESEAHIEALAGQLRIGYDHSVSERLSRALPALDSYLDLCPEVPLTTRFEVERLNTRQLGWELAPSWERPGLYRYKLYGRHEFRYQRGDGSTLRIDDAAIGAYAELRRADRMVLRYEKEPPTGALIVPFNAPLPPLYSRAAALCSGVLPTRDEGGWRYENIPAHIAERIASGLAQQLT
jgi:hypothetical protein